MGWRELRGWLRAMQRAQRAARAQHEPDPERWTDASRENFAALDAERQRLRGR